MEQINFQIGNITSKRRLIEKLLMHEWTVYVVTRNVNYRLGRFLIYAVLGSGRLTNIKDFRVVKLTFGYIPHVWPKQIISAFLAIGHILNGSALNEIV